MWLFNLDFLIMIKIFSTFKLENFKYMINRFSISFVIIITTTTLFFLLNNLDFPHNSKSIEFLYKCILSFILVFFFSIWIYLSCENLKISENKKSLFQLIPIAFWILFYSNFDFNLNLYDYYALILFSLSWTWIIAYMFFAPYIILRQRKRLISLKMSQKTELSNSLYYQYFYKTAIVFIFGFVLWWILFALWSLAILSLNLLFNLSWNFTNDFYSNWAIISLSFITPIVCLMNLPRDNLKEDKNFELNIFTNFVIKYVFVSFILMYFIILYAYTIKVLLNFNDWPKWEVCWLVILFSTFGYITYILTYYLESKIKVINIFRKIFPFIVIPQIFMLFYAIYLRINQYNLTINRYFVVVFGIWLLIISLYFIFSKKKNLIVIPVILTLFIIVISIWPWSIYNFPESMQIARLQKNLEKAWILVNWEIFPLHNYDSIDKELSKEIYNDIYYICYNSDCNKIASMFWENTKKTKLETITQITEKIQMKNYYTTQPNESKHLYIRAKDIYPINIESYTYMTEIVNQDYDKPISTNTYELTYELIIKVNIEDDILYVVQDNEIKEQISMWNFKEKIRDKYDKSFPQNILPKEELIFEINGQKYDIKLLIQYIEISDSNNYSYVSGYALIKQV